MEEPKKRYPIINAHAHVFTHKHVPPFLGKKVIPWPFYYLFHLSVFIWLYVKCSKFNDRKYKSRYKRRAIGLHKIKRFILSHFALKLIYYVGIAWITLSAFFIAFDLLIQYNQSSQLEFVTTFHDLKEWCLSNRIIFQRPNWLPYSIVLMYLFVVLFCFRSVRNFLFFVFTRIWKLFNLLPGKKTRDLLERYLMMARFTSYKHQQDVFTKLKRQYPVGTQFILLPMDMKYMDAGRIKEKWSYHKQMKELIPLSKREDVHPFIFIDPRRIRDEGKAFFDYTFVDGKIKLNPCFIKTYIETHKFVGFKIYPALGYFPFDADLLPLWKYAAENQIPIMTHGIKGVIYYRGNVTKLPSFHPVFKEGVGNQKYEQLYFDQLKNDRYQINLTHPLNYLCLLEEPLLRILLQQDEYKKHHSIFGYKGADVKLEADLSELKICFAHFGGAEEWTNYLERDRDNYAQQLITKPETGIVFNEDDTTKINWIRYERLWKYTDWYSLCCSMMIQYPNFYTDISYIVSNTSLYPLLRNTLSDANSLENLFDENFTYKSRGKLRSRILFGSDFYVVRSKKADKDIFTELKSYLTESEFDLIARENPAHYLKNKLN